MLHGLLHGLMDLESSFEVRPVFILMCQKMLCVKIVPKLLTLEQNARGVTCCEDWLETEERCSFLKRIITQNE